MRRISDRLYRQREFQTALSYAPPIYPCAKCGSPVADGCVCGWCGDADPSKYPRVKMAREDVKNARR